MGYPRKATAAAIADMEQVARTRLQARAVSNQDIADKHHLPLVVVNRWMSRIYQALQGSTILAPPPPGSLEALAEEVLQAHIRREDVPDHPLVPRPFVPRPRPKTAIIAEAAKEAEAARKWMDAVKDESLEVSDVEIERLCSLG